MAESVGDSGDTVVVVERRSRWRTLLTWVAIGILLLIVAALIVVWVERRPIFGHRTSFVELPAERAIDIDTPADWALAERRFEEWKARD